MLNACYRRTGLISAPLPAISQTATRAHVQSFASVCQLNVLLPNGRVSVKGNVFVNVCLPSPQTISANASGKVHCTFAVALMAVGDFVDTSTFGSSTSPMEMK